MGDLAIVLWGGSINGFVAILAATLSGIAALIAVRYDRGLESNRLKMGTRNIIAAEIQGLLVLIEHLDYENVLQKYIELIENGHEHYFYFSADHSYTKVYDSSLVNLGLLGPVADEVVQFYMFINSVLETNKEIKKLKSEYNLPIEAEFKKTVMLEIHKHQLKELRRIKEMGNKIIGQLRKHSTY